MVSRMLAFIDMLLAIGMFLFTISMTDFAAGTTTGYIFMGIGLYASFRMAAHGLLGALR